MLLPDAITAFLDQKAAEGLSPRTITGYAKNLRQLAHAMARRGVRAAADVTAADLDAHLGELARRGLAYSSRLGHAGTIRECFRVLHANGRVLRNPALDLPVADDDDAALPEAPLEAVEVAALIAVIPRRDAIDLRNRAHIEVLYGCALRLNESLTLDVDDLDLGRRTVVVRAGKGGRDRTVPLMKGALGAVKDYVTVRRHLLAGPDHGALFLNNRGQRVGPFVMQHLLADLARRAGIARRVHPHLLRHSIAVHLLRGGADIRHVQAFLGHVTLETTKIYLRMVPGHLRDEYDKAMPTIAVNGQVSSESKLVVDPTDCPQG